MREFGRHRGRLRRLPLGARVVYTTYLLFTLVGLAVAALLYSAGPSFDVSKTRSYYAGGAVAAEPLADPLGDSQEADLDADDPAPAGPVLDLGGLGDPTGARPDSVVSSGPEPLIFSRPPMNTKRLIEITHGHLFMMPLILLIISHLFVLAGFRRLLNTVMISGGTLSVAAHIATPWLIRDVSTDWAVLLALSGVGLAVFVGGMALLSLIVLWWPRRAKAAA